MNKSRLIIILIFIHIILLTGCGEQQAHHSRYRVVRHTKNPYSLLYYIKEVQIPDNETVPNDTLLVILKKYSPNAYYLVQRMENIPDTIKIGNFIVTTTVEGTARRTITTSDGRRTVKVLTGKGFRKWIDNEKPFISQIEDIGTAVHEICHGYTGRYAIFLLSKKVRDISQLMYYTGQGNNASSANFDSFYRDRDTTLTVLRRRVKSNTYTNAFPAKKIIPMIPEEKRTLRFKTYIQSFHSAQVTGISGLLDEYNAYYWSNKVAYDLYNYYRLELPQTPQTWGKWIGHVAGYYFSYVEFRYWILKYLQYAKNNEPKIYQSFMRDKHLRSAFTLIDNEFTELIQKIFQRMFVELPAYLKTIGINTYINSKGVTYLQGKKIIHPHYAIGNTSRGFYTYYYLPLQEELLKPEMMDIANEFRTTPFREFPLLRIPEALIRR